jgi:hypothetical protein
MLVYLFLLLQIPALLGYYYQVPYWVKRDAAAFALNPTDDTFHRKFHRQRLLIRIGTSLLLALVPALPLALAGHPVAAVFSAGALLSIGTGYWSYAFNPGLNRARNLPYVSAYYVSYDANAAYFPDRRIWSQAYAKAHPGQPVVHVYDEQVEAVASTQLEEVLRLLLRLGIGIYVGLTGLVLVALLRAI